MSEVNNIIKMPINPEEIGVSLPSDRLRRIDFSALDFESSRRATLEYVRTYFPDDFNDFVLSNGFIMFSEIVSASTNKLSQRSDIIASESFLSTAQTRRSTAEHLLLIGQTLRRQTPATVSVECSIANQSSFDTVIPPGLIFNASGPDGSPVFYELYSAPGDFSGNIVIPRGRRGIVAFGIEGKFASPIQEISNGDINQFIEIPNPRVIDEPIIVAVSDDGDSEIILNRVKFLQLAGPNDEVFEVKHLDDRTLIIFGDNINGKSPISGQQITVRYRIGGGARGRIGSGAIDEARPVSQDQAATQNILFRNLDPSIGGQDKESIESAKRRAPRQYAIHENVATVDDYINTSEGFSHPVFGTVAKASVAVRTGIDSDLDEVVNNVRNAPNIEQAKKYLLGNYVNRNIVEIYILQDDSVNLVSPSAGLKQALKTRLSEINVFTDEARVLNGLVRPINIDARIIVSRNVDAAIVKEQVDFAIFQIFDFNSVRMGQGFNKSELITAIQSVPGIRSVTLFSPVDDLPSLGSVVQGDEDGIGINQIYVLGSSNVQFFYERSNLNF